MKTKFWNGSFLRTVLQCLAIACAALLALSALGAGLVLGGVVDQKQIPAAAFGPMTVPPNTHPPGSLRRFFFQHGSRFQCCSRFFRSRFRGSCRRRQGPEHLVLER